MQTRLIAGIVVVLFGLGFAVAAKAPVRWDKSTGLSEPKIVKKVNPTYPDDARNEGVQGTVILDATVDTDGKVIATKVSQDPDSRLSAAAVDAVKQWAFAPARDDKGEPVVVVYTVTVAFKLE